MNKVFYNVEQMKATDPNTVETWYITPQCWHELSHLHPSLEVHRPYCGKPIHVLTPFQQAQLEFDPTLVRPIQIALVIFHPPHGELIRGFIPVNIEDAIMARFWASGYSLQAEPLRTGQCCLAISDKESDLYSVILPPKYSENDVIAATEYLLRKLS